MVAAVMQAEALEILRAVPSGVIERVGRCPEALRSVVWLNFRITKVKHTLNSRYALMNSSPSTAKDQLQCRIVS